MTTVVMMEGFVCHCYCCYRRHGGNFLTPLLHNNGNQVRGDKLVQACEDSSYLTDSCKIKVHDSPGRLNYQQRLCTLIFWYLADCKTSLSIPMAAVIY